MRLTRLTWIAAGEDKSSGRVQEFLEFGILRSPHQHASKTFFDFETDSALCLPEMQRNIAHYRTLGFA